MRFITTKAHGAMDYGVGALLIVLPWLLGFHRGGAETWVPASLGGAIILYSLMTDYELAAVHGVPMRLHLKFDFVLGFILAASPWLFGFMDDVFWPHFVAGCILMVASVFTHRVPQHGPQSRRTTIMRHKGSLGNAV